MKLFTLASLALILFACEDEDKIRNVEGHIYLKSSWGIYAHDIQCPKCEQNRLEIELDETK